MKDQSKTKQVLIRELVSLRQTVAELKQSEVDRKLAENQYKLAEANQMLQLVLDTIPVRIFWKDLNLSYLGCNRLFAQDAGRQLPSDLIGESDYDMGWREQADLYRNDDQEVIATGESKINYEESQTSPEGNRIWLRTSKVPLRDLDDRIIGILGTYDDITERKQVAVALRDSEERFRSMIQSLSDMILILDGDGQFTYESPSVSQILGYRPGHFLGRSPIEYIHPDDLDQTVKALEDVIQSDGDGIPTEFRYRKADGTWVYLEAIGSNQFENPGIRGIILTARDITVRKQAEEALHELEGKFRDLSEKCIVGIYLYQDGRFKYVNAEFADVLGYSPEEIIDRLYLKDLIFSEDLPMVEDNVRRRMTGEEKSRRYEFRARTKDGKLKRVEVYGSRTHYQGKTAVIGTVLDLTERLKAEEELRRLSIAIEQAVEDIVITDPEGVIQYVNPAFEKITGYSRVEVIGGNPRILKSGVHDPAFYEDLWSTVKGGKIWSGRITNRRKDGRLFQEDAIISPMFNAAGELMGYVALKRDVTESVRLETSSARRRRWRPSAPWPEASPMTSTICWGR